MRAGVRACGERGGGLKVEVEFRGVDSGFCAALHMDCECNVGRGQAWRSNICLWEPHRECLGYRD